MTKATRAPLFKRPLHFSLRRQIIAALVGAAIIVAFASGVVMKDLETDYLRQTINQQSQATFHVLSAAALEAVITEDQPLLNTIIQQVVGEEGDILTIDINNERGQTLAKWKNKKIRDTSDTLSFSKQVAFEGEIFGNIDITWNFMNTRAEIERHALIIQLSVGAGMILLAALILGIVETFAIKPVNSISKRLIEFTEGNFRGGFTGTRLASSELHRLNDAVNKLGEALELKERQEKELKETLAQLQQAQKMETVGNLTGGIAHDFNNLLGILIGNLDLLKEMLESDEDASELVDAALEAGLRGKDLNRRLLAFARRQSLKPETIDVNETLASMTKLLQRSLGERVEISIRSTADIWSVTVDPTQLETAILNLGVNARDAMPNGGKLAIETANVHLDDSFVDVHEEVIPGPYVMLAVSDEGIGMAEEIVKRVFDPFFTTKEVGQGTGLGLSMVHGFIKQSGGHVSVYSEKGIGTTVKLFLPRDANSVAEAEDDSKSQKQPHGHGQRVLLVEDNEGMRKIARKQLSDLGYEVLEADRASAALEILEKGENVDLVFSDVVMPGELDGIGLANRLSKDYPGLPVLLTSGFTARASDDFEGTAISETNAELLAKPYRKEELALAIDRNLRAATA
jgi:signal transduction histidine kinase/ActR/RegA family two-component response regulator